VRTYIGSSAMDSLDTVEMVMAFEEVFEVDMPNADSAAEGFDNSREIVHWLEARLSNQRPNKAARTLLRKLAEDQLWPELSEALDENWRREQIEALVREIFR
jgi:acyl carrier protein